MTRHFIIERYARGMWPAVRGERPFLVRGPRWESARDSAWDFDDGLPDHPLSRRVIAEFLLREGAVVAAWSALGSPMTAAERWEASVRALAAEVPTWGYFGDGYAPGVAELLDSMSDLGWYESYLAEDRVGLIPMAPIPQGEKICETEEV